jgi:hypothetical protein
VHHHHHHWWQVDTAISDATLTIHNAAHTGGWTPPQLRRLRQLGPGSWYQAASSASPGWPDDYSSNPVVEIAIYPDVVRLVAHRPRADNARAPCGT